MSCSSHNPFHQKRHVSLLTTMLYMERSVWWATSPGGTQMINTVCTAVRPWHYKLCDQLTSAEAITKRATFRRLLIWTTVLSQMRTFLSADQQTSGNQTCRRADKLANRHGERHQSKMTDESDKKTCRHAEKTRKTILRVEGDDLPRASVTTTCADDAWRPATGHYR